MEKELQSPNYISIRVVLSEQNIETINLTTIPLF